MKNKIANFRVSVEEKADLDRQAQAAGFKSVSDYLRSLVFSEDVETKATGQTALVAADAEVIEAKAPVPTKRRFTDPVIQRYAKDKGIEFEVAFEILEERKP